MKPEMESGVVNCANCHSPMPAGLRFCRNCGFRLGEGVAEYTETVRFKNAPPGMLPGNNPANAVPYGFSSGPMVAPGKVGKRRRMSGMTWMFIGLLIFFIAAGAFTAIVKQVRRNVGPGVNVTLNEPRSFVGMYRLEMTDAGVTFASSEPANGPADKAGLVGGDIITTLDGKPVHSDDEMMDFLRGIPIGKTVDVVYVRDGETKTAKLTTISEEEQDRLDEAAGAIPRAQFGYDDDDVERVEIPNTKMHGVQLGEILANRPADLAGVQPGDIVIQFGDTPIRTPREFLSRVRRAVPYSTVKMTVIRNGEKLEIPVKMGKQ